MIIDTIYMSNSSFGAMMAPSTRSDGKINLNLSGTSPVSDLSSEVATSNFSSSKFMNGGILNMGTARHGAGSPLHDSGSRLFPKRTRELQVPNGLGPSIWGPPTSGTSTPLFEIPESPSQDGFPDLVPITETGTHTPARRARAGTLPSRMSPAGTINGLHVPQITSITSRPSPSTSPFKLPTSSTPESSAYAQTSSSNSALLSRLRAGSLPQRSSYIGPSSPFGQSVFGPGWNNRDRSMTMNSSKASEEPNSPAQSAFSRELMTDAGVRTLDYLGLAETPQQKNATPFRPISSSILQQELPSALPDLMAKLDLRNANRFRSFSVNAPHRYGEESEEDPGNQYDYQNGMLTPSAAAALEAYEAVQEKVRLHNQAVQAFAENASNARPRARTAGIVETPQRTSLRNFMTKPPPMSNGHVISSQSSSAMNDSLSDSLAFHSLNLNGDGLSNRLDTYDDEEGQTSRSLWIGSIPVSTTTSSLDAIFSRYGPLESTRVLTHKNCGFVNFESLENAIRARQLLNGKEIFPGAGPVRIGFAKVPNSSASVTPAHNTLPPSPTRDAYNSDEVANGTSSAGGNTNVNSAMNGAPAAESSTTSYAIRLSELQSDILQIVVEFGAHDSDLPIISTSIENAIAYQQLQSEILPIAEPTHTRVYDAPRLRDIRKRIDNGACGMQEIEQIANDILPEIAELASDYLGNTVVQKLFEYCSEQTKEMMLTYIAPHLAEIGIHKNGTWAAQKIIEVCRTESQTRLIVEHLRPFTVPLFLDQYGNYVVQCCLRFGPPYNDFIFETMVSQLWEIAQGRFGARAMRACLEAHQATKHQQRMIAAVIAVHSVKLATNTNGALLLTWFMDTCTFPRRRTVLTPRLIPHLVHLCTHKVAYLTVLKVINQRNELEAREMILNAIFFSTGDAVLEQILSDQTSGATFIFKILTTPFFDDRMRTEVARNVAKVLTKIKAQPNQGYKRLMDEVGLSSRPVHPAAHNVQSHPHPLASPQSRSISQPATANYMQPQILQRQYSGGYTPNVNPPTFESGQSPARTGSADSFGFPSYGLNSFPAQPSFTPLQQYTPQQVQYQNFLAASQRSNGNYMPSAGANAFAGYATPPPSVEVMRGMQNHGPSLHLSAQMSPVMGPGAFGPPSYGQNLPGNLYGYQQQNFYPQQMQAVHGPGRNRRMR